MANLPAPAIAIPWGMRMVAMIGLVALFTVASATPVSAKTAARRDAKSCLAALDRLGVDYKRVKRKGIKIAVEVVGDIGGVRYRSYRKKPLVLDCSLVVSLAEAGRFFAFHGVDTVTYSSAYQIRNIRGTKRRSKHSFGLAIDVHSFSGVEIGELAVKHDYELGLGDSVDCIGTPMTREAQALRAIDCQMQRSGLFRIILDPDYDGSHYNHFHVESRAWSERDDFGADGGRQGP